MRIDDWFLTAAERGNPATRLDARRGGVAWSAGNEVRPLIHGAAYFAELLARIPAMQAGDLLLFTDWRGDPDQRLTTAGPPIADLLCAAARRGVLVRGLVWRSHLDRFQFSGQENRQLGEEVEKAGGECVLDMRVRPGGSHHMKMVVLRHAGRPAADVAFVGGIDLCHSRRDDACHAGDPQRQPMAAVYGDRPPWHDVQAMVQGPAVGDVEAVFRERWEDPAPPTRNPVRRLRDLLAGVEDRAGSAPAARPAAARHPSVQLLRTYPYRRRGYAFAPDGERSVARGYLKVLPRARSLIYLEDQYLWSTAVVAALARALRDRRELRLIAVIPRFPDTDRRLSTPPNLVGRIEALDTLRQAGGDRVAVYSPENPAGTPVYVHAKVCIVDDTWASSARTTSTGARGPTTPSSAAPSSTSRMGRPRPAPGARRSGWAWAATRTRCGPRSAASTSAAMPMVTWTAPAALSRRSAARPPHWTPGTRTGGAARGRPGGCAATAGRGCRRGPWRGRSSPTG